MINIPTNFHESKLKVKRKERKREKDRGRMNECDVELHEPDEQFIDTIEIVVGDKSFSIRSVIPGTLETIVLHMN